MEFPRRNDLQRLKPAELAIYNVMQMIEEMPADPRLTDVQIKLDEVKNLLADYIEAPSCIRCGSYDTEQCGGEDEFSCNNCGQYIEI